MDQDDDYQRALSCAEKLQDLQPHLFSLVRGKDTNAELTSVEVHSFRTINGSLGFLGMGISPFAYFAPSHLQQTEGHPSIHDTIRQLTLLKATQKLGTVCIYRVPGARRSYKLFILIFADAGKPSANAQLGFVGGLLIGGPENSSVIHALHRGSHLLQRPVR